MTLEEELDLVQKAKTNVQYFDKLYGLYIDRIYTFIFRRVANKDLAEDLTSLVFLKAVESIQKFDSSKGFRFGSWLYKISQNLIIDYFRKHKKKVDLDFDKTQLPYHHNYSEQMLFEINQKQVAFVLTKIHERYQEILALRFFAELEIIEIAEVLNQKPKNVSVILHRALGAFRKEFVKNFPKSEIFDL